MAIKVTLTISNGSLKGKKYQFSDRTTCVIGRAKDCYPRLPNTQDHITVSRYHCLLDINPPAIRLRDFGSKNGTYVNTNKIGQRRPGQTPEEGAKIIFREHDIKDGDEIKIGQIILSVNIQFDTDHERDTYTRHLETDEKGDLFTIVKKLLRRGNKGEKELSSLAGYKLIKLLGSGNFGEVYLAEHEHRDEQVVLELMSPQVRTNANGIESFLRDIKNSQMLDHTNILTLKDGGFEEETFFLLWEYCPDGTVTDLMRSSENNKLSLNESLSIILQVLDGLEYAHTQLIPYQRQNDDTIKTGRGLIHKDLRPENIFLKKINGKIVAKIADYGISKGFDLAGLSGQTLTGVKAGTPAFMPRQQVLDFRYNNPDADVWSAAACLYYMITGWLPRNFMNANDPFLVVLQSEVIPIKQRDNSIPDQLAQIIDKALIDNPEIVYKTPLDFKEALLSVL